MKEDSSIVIPCVSVIIPIYNTENYLREALDSICNQTLQELEIILINDGSTDNSQAIIEEYAQKDIRIHYSIQSNQGQGVARNNGLQLATGKYIYFMDSDDILETDALRQCYQICEQDKLDIICFDAETFAEDSDYTGFYHYCRQNIINETKIWTGIELLNYELEHNVFFVPPWLFFTNHRFLQKHFSGFPAGIIHEDQIFAMQILLHASHIRYIPQTFFKRRIRNQSTMTTRFSMRNIEGYTTVCTRISEWSKNNINWKTSIQMYLYNTLNAVIWLGHIMTLLEKLETVCRFQRLHLSRYITFRNWLVFWFKKR